MIGVFTFAFGAMVGLTVGLFWHWWVFARYDEWIVDNGGKLPPPETP